MKIILKKVFILIFCLILGLVTVLAAPDPPPPNNGRLPPSPPGLSIDENMPFLILITLFFGMYVIFNHIQKAKT